MLDDVLALPLFILPRISEPFPIRLGILAVSMIRLSRSDFMKSSSKDIMASSGFAVFIG
jgi:hypothetical protein